MRFLPLVLVAAIIAGCDRASTPITVTNGSAETIRNIHLSGPGFESSISALEPGESETVRVDPSGEAGLAMSFDVGSRHVETPEQGYFETGYDVTAKVQPDFKVDVDGEM